MYDAKLSMYQYIAVKSPVAGHPWDHTLREVFTDGRLNLQCLYVAGMYVFVCGWDVD